jgi:hypothetical protein
MALKFNGVEIPEGTGEIIFSGVSLTEVIFNGVVYWQKGTGTIPPDVPSFCSASDGEFTDHVEVTYGYSGLDVIYKIERSGDDGTTWGIVGSVTNGDLYFDDFTASLGTTYLYRVRACWQIDDETCSGYSPEDEGSLASGPPTGQPPTEAPGSMTATTTYYNKIIINWTVGTEDNATMTAIYRDGTFIDVVPFDTREYQDMTVSPDSTYAYHTAFRNEHGEGPASTEVQGSTVDTQPFVLRSGDAMQGPLRGVAPTGSSDLIRADAYATSSRGGTIKARFDGTVLFISTDGSDP